MRDPMARSTRLIAVLLSILVVVSASCIAQPPTETLQPADRARKPTSLTAAGLSDAALARAVKEARQHLEALSEEIGPRLPGSSEEEEAAGYIQEAFEEYGYDPQVQYFSFTDEDDEELESANVFVVKRGASRREIIVGAHYDSTDDGEGADDNASGVAVLLAIAGLLQDVETPYTVRLIAFGAEEAGLYGSAYYVEQMSKSAVQNMVAMINLDSLIAGDITYVYGDAGAGSLRNWIISAAKDEEFDLGSKTARQMDEDDGTPCDCADYDAFQEADIPFAYFEATNWNLGEEDGMTQVDPDLGEDGEIRHTEYDTLEDIDDLFPGRVQDHTEVFITLLYDALTRYEEP